MEEAITKAEETLNRVNLWSNEATATAGVGYAILALTKVIKVFLEKKN